MEHIAIEARLRGATVTKGERKRLRRAGQIPAAVFGKGMDAVLVTVEARDLAKVLGSDAGTNTLIDLSLGTQRHLVKLTEVDIDPITRTFQHVGLHKIQANEQQKAVVSVEIIGEPEAVRLGDGLLEQGTLAIEVRSLPDSLPAHLSLDVSALTIGDALHASDVPLPAGVELVSPPDTGIVSLRVARELPSDDLGRDADAEADSNTQATAPNETVAAGGSSEAKPAS